MARGKPCPAGTARQRSAAQYQFRQETLALREFRRTFRCTRCKFCVKIKGVIWLAHCRLEGRFDLPAVQLLQNKDSSKVLRQVSALVLAGRTGLLGARGQEEILRNKKTALWLSI